MSEITHEEICDVADAISQPPYDPKNYLLDDPAFHEARATTMSLGFFRGIAELKARGYKVIKGAGE
ncbi:MAG: hypothetical protein EOM21_18770 [Gammaproteobacteria bacterium]|nr:hypothetical protein [Gammaproteobacteria bacterium]